MEPIIARFTELNIRYAGASIFNVDSESITSFSYSDKSSGESDSIDIEINDRSKDWLIKHFPRKNDRIKASVIQNSGDIQKILECGQFTLDDISMSGDPLTVSLKAVSSPVSTGFSVTERSKVWKNITIKSIASDIAKRAGISLWYDADDIRIASVEQSNQTDSAFLSEICQTYGICMKVYSDKIILYSLQKALNKTPVLTVKKGEMESWSFDTSLDGNYTGGQLTYSNTDGKDIKYSVGGGNRILKITDKKPADYAEAERMIKAAALLKNLETTTLSFSCPGRLDIVASQNIQIKGIGAGIDGKYHVLSVSHKISGGFKSDFELAKVE